MVDKSSKITWTPQPYQLRALSLMMKQGSVGLFLDPGLGKTSICLMAFKILLEKGLVRKALIVAPLRPVYKVWPDEVRKWADFGDITYTVLHGAHKERALAENVNLYLINPEGIKWLFDPKRKRPDFDVLIIDESTLFKDSTTQRFRALKPFLPSFTRRWILTGTPVPNGLMDLFGQIYLLDLGRSLGRFITHYRQQYFVPSGYGGYDWKIRPGAYEEIVEQISPLILQLSAEEYLQMPEIVYRAVVVDIPQDVKKVYDELEDNFIATLSSSQELIALNAAAAGTKLRQIANGAVYTTSPLYTNLHDEKLDALESLLRELHGNPVLLLYEFDHDRERIIGRLGDTPCLSGMAGERLGRLVDNFNAGHIPVLMGHPASMGHGLNLQGACHHIIWFGITWNLEHYDQAIARVYRQGQKSDRVFIYHIVARGTKDEQVLKVLEKKDRTQQDLLSSLKIAREQVVDSHEQAYTI